MKEQTQEGNVVLFQGHLERILASADKGGLSLPEDMKGASGKWVTLPDEKHQDRKEMMSDLIAHNTATYSLMSSHEQVEVYRVCWCVMKLSIIQKQRVAAEALDRIVRQPGEVAMAAACRLVRAVRAASADPDHPQLTDIYASTRTMQDLLERFSRMIAPAPADRVAVKSVVMMHARQLIGELPYHPVVQDHLMSTEMRARG